MHYKIHILVNHDVLNVGTSICFQNIKSPCLNVVLIIVYYCFGRISSFLYLFYSVHKSSAVYFWSSLCLRCNFFFFFFLCDAFSLVHITSCTCLPVFIRKPWRQGTCVKSSRSLGVQRSRQVKWVCHFSKYQWHSKI